MNDRGRVVLSDGRIGKIVRVDTVFPSNDTTLMIWTKTASGSAVTRVGLGDVVGAVDARDL